MFQIPIWYNSYFFRLINQTKSILALPFAPAICTSEFHLVVSRGPKIAKAKDLIRKWKLNVGDEVGIISGTQKGRTGKIIMVDHRRNMVKVSGCNLRRVYMNQRFYNVEKKIHYSNVHLIDPITRKPCRVTLRYIDNESHPVG